MTQEPGFRIDGRLADGRGQSLARAVAEEDLRAYARLVGPEVQMVHDGAAAPPRRWSAHAVSRGVVHASLELAMGRLKHFGGYQIEHESPNRDLVEVVRRRLLEAWRTVSADF